MRWNPSLAPTTALLLGLLGSAPRTSLAADTTVVKDPATGFTFTQYLAQYSTDADALIAYRVAVPATAPGSGSAGYDLVVQVGAPSAVGWAGLAWGGHMTDGPLAVAWWASGSEGEGDGAVVSARRSSSYTTPQYDAATTLTLLPGGTSANATYWQYTALCRGCSSFASALGGSANTSLAINGTNALAWAYSPTGPAGDAADDANATIQAHDAFGYWSHDFAGAGNVGFDALVQRNM
ncbi:hypothetical protein GGR56DRAFT_675133 [Xylariaceae sp. FL0804]|nr:hypothetical protein GGR56DRAFT_675133 [Xylariaceae sp. FL0804]